MCRALLKDDENLYRYANQFLDDDFRLDDNDDDDAATEKSTTDVAEDQEISQPSDDMPHYKTMVGKAIANKTSNSIRNDRNVTSKVLRKEVHKKIDKEGNIFEEDIVEKKEVEEESHNAVDNEHEVQQRSVTAFDQRADEEVDNFLDESFDSEMDESREKSNEDADNDKTVEETTTNEALETSTTYVYQDLRPGAHLNRRPDYKSVFGESVENKTSTSHGNDRNIISKVIRKEIHKKFNEEGKIVEEEIVEEEEDEEEVHDTDDTVHVVTEGFIKAFGLDDKFDSEIGADDFSEFRAKAKKDADDGEAVEKTATDETLETTTDDVDVSSKPNENPNNAPPEKPFIRSEKTSPQKVELKEHLKAYLVDPPPLWPAQYSYTNRIKRYVNSRADDKPFVRSSKTSSQKVELKENLKVYLVEPPPLWPPKKNSRRRNKRNVDSQADDDNVDEEVSNEATDKEFNKVAFQKIADNSYDDFALELDGDDFTESYTQSFRAALAQRPFVRASKTNPKKVEN